MRKIFVAVVFLILLSTNANAADFKHSWEWEILAVPPSSGWDSEPGHSISNALAWCEREIAASGSGVGGHDIKFTRLVLLSDDQNLRSLSLNITPRVLAVMSFQNYDGDRILIERLAGREVPLFLAGGENVLIEQGGRPLANIFALDLFRDYRCSAFAEYAKKIFAGGKDIRMALAASRFTVNQEREAKICYDILDKNGFMPMPFWTDASVRDTFNMMSEEIESQENNPGIMISFLGSMGSREVWRNFMRLNTKWQLWNCSAPENAYLSCRGMVLADQNIKLNEVGGFENLKRQIWNTRALAIMDNVYAGRAVALVEWLKRGVNSLPQPVNTIPRGALLRSLEHVRDIPFGNQTLNINPILHRPERRNIYLVEVRNKMYRLLDTLNIAGMKFTNVY